MDRAVVVNARLRAPGEVGTSSRFAVTLANPGMSDLFRKDSLTTETSGIRGASRVGRSGVRSPRYLDGAFRVAKGIRWPGPQSAFTYRCAAKLRSAAEKVRLGDR